MNLTSFSADDEASSHERILPIPPGILDSLPVAIYACDAEGRLLSFNDRATRIWGRIPAIGDDRERFCGSQKRFDPSGHSMSRDGTPMAYVLKSGSPLDGVGVLIERPDGSRVSTIVHIDPVRDASGHVVGAVGCFHEAPEPYRSADVLADAERRQRDLMASLPIAVFSCDERGRIVGFNRRAAEFWGRAPRLNDLSELYCASVRAFDTAGSEIPRVRLPVAEALETGRFIHGRELSIERPDGSRLSVVANVDPVRDATNAIVGVVVCFLDVSDRKREDAEAQAVAKRLRVLLDALPAAIYTTDRDGKLTFFNRAAAELAGREPKIGLDRWCVSWKLYNTDGSPVPHDECPVAVAIQENRPLRGVEMIAERPDGTLVPFIPYPTLLRDETGDVSGAVNMLIDISDRKNAEERQKILIDEVNHRVKNTLATVQSLAAQSMRNTGVAQAARDAFDARLFALSRAHDQLIRERWASADLRALASEIVAPHNAEGHERIRLWGDPVRLAAETAITLGMIFHEFATNAAKFGALSVPGGVVALSWRETADATGAARLVIDWQEYGGPVVSPPERKGLGTRLLDRGIVDGLKGIVRIDYDPAGIHCAIDIPRPDTITT